MARQSDENLMEFILKTSCKISTYTSDTFNRFPCVSFPVAVKSFSFLISQNIFSLIGSLGH